MRRVELEAVVRSTAPQDVFDQVVCFERYAALAPHVQSATVHEGPPGPTGRSSWELHFRSGLLRWTETERFDRAALRIEFRQDEGDFDEFSGVWPLAEDGGDCLVRFHADFDFGIPSLAGILDPIAERVIAGTIAWVLVGMFPRVDLLTGADLLSTTTPATTTPATT